MSDIHGNVFNSGNFGNFGLIQSGQSNVHIGPPVESQDAGATSPPDTMRRQVFVVHGRDEHVLRSIMLFLRRLDLRPLGWGDVLQGTGESSPFLGQAVARGAEMAQAAIVILTPDDLAMLHPALRDENELSYETALAGQPRPNVLIELGMVMMAFPQRTILIEVGAVRPIADLAGRNVVRLDGSEVSLAKIVERLKGAGCQVDDTGADWRDTSPFRDLDAYYRHP